MSTPEQNSSSAPDVVVPDNTTKAVVAPASETAISPPVAVQESSPWYRRSLVLLVAGVVVVALVVGLVLLFRPAPSVAVDNTLPPAPTASTIPSAGDLTIKGEVITQMPASCVSGSCSYTSPETLITLKAASSETLTLSAREPLAYTVSVVDVDHPTLSVPLTATQSKMNLENVNPGHYQVTLIAQPTGAAWQFDLDVTAAKKR